MTRHAHGRVYRLPLALGLHAQTALAAHLARQALRVAEAAHLAPALRLCERCAAGQHVSGWLLRRTMHRLLAEEALCARHARNVTAAYQTWQAAAAGAIQAATQVADDASTSVRMAIAVVGQGRVLAQAHYRLCAQRHAARVACAALALGVRAHGGCPGCPGWPCCGSPWLLGRALASAQQAAVVAVRASDAGAWLREAKKVTEAAPLARLIAWAVDSTETTQITGRGVLERIARQRVRAAYRLAKAALIHGGSASGDAGVAVAVLRELR